MLIGDVSKIPPFYKGSDFWGDPYFSTSHISKLTNSKKLPLVLSINCNTGHYDHNSCFAQKFISHPYGGAVGVIAAGGQTPSSYNDLLSEEIFRVITNSDIINHTHGDILSEALTSLSSKTNSIYVTYEREVYTIFGDPGTILYMDKNPLPKKISLKLTNKSDNKRILEVGENGLCVSINDVDTGILYKYSATHIDFSELNLNNYTIWIEGEGIRPFYLECKNGEEIYLNSEAYDSDISIDAPIINVGESFLNIKSIGKCEFIKGEFNLVGKVVINSNVIIHKGAKVNISI